MAGRLSKRDFLRLTGAGVFGSALAPVLSAAGVPLSAISSPAPQAHASGKLYAYISSWTAGANGSGGDGGIRVFSVDQNSGSLTQVSAVSPQLSAGYICISPDTRFLYATDERKDEGGKAGAGGAVHAFAIHPSDGSLEHLNSYPSMGAFPAYVAIDATGKRVVAANHGSYDNITRLVKGMRGYSVENLYDDATVAMFPVDQTGTLEPACDVAVLKRTHGVDPRFQGSAHAHSANFDPGNRFLLVCDKGADHIYIYHFEPGSRALTPVSVYTAPPGSAPRHSAFHPRRPFVFVINELQSSLTSFHFDAQTGAITPIHTVPTLAASSPAAKTNNPADIHLHPNGKFVYGSNRGDDSIAVFQLNEATGKLTRVAVTPCGGQTPRAFNLDPSGKFLYAANQDSNNVVAFSVDPSTGLLKPTGAVAQVPKPVCIKFALL